ncbi:MAG: hypothetical protein HWN65_04305 [Candidatus Helarchaeota archaeon]|nr:hypothetical protein [Candidatus Helarchaeota archaeon]
MNKKLVLIVVIICAALTTTLVLVLFPWEQPGERKAFIVCSANDFYGSEEEPDFNDGFDSNFSADTGRWWKRVGPGVNYTIDPGYTGAITSPGAVWIERPDIDLYAEYIYDWSDYYALKEYAYYNLSVWVNTEGAPLVGEGIKIGLEWWNSSNQVVRTDWSGTIPAAADYTYVSVEGVCNNDTGNEITQLKLIMAMNGSFPSALTDTISYDDVRLIWVTVNLTDPSNPDPPPPPRNKNCDGFPAQALHVYKVLKAHGYTDENIFFMLYWKDDTDGLINIKLGDGIANDLVGAVIDVENDSVTASRVKQELDVSVAGSFASTIRPNDQLIIYMGDHGSNKVLPDGNATFHFETDGSVITEAEFYALVSQINCERMMINIDCCFSGNFLNENNNIGASWYDIPNYVFVSAAANRLAWYWVDCNNGDGFAGSWFFHQFWEQLDQGQTVANAYNFAVNFWPFGKAQPLAGIQSPLMHDTSSDSLNTWWSFSSSPSL